MRAITSAWVTVVTVVILVISSLVGAGSASAADAPLPAGVSVVWDLGHAWREATPTRERVCINGLWRWQPADAVATETASVPSDNWGHFKVPGSWPGIADYLQQDSQTVFPHDAWKDRRLGDVNAAWYQREIEIPREWAGRHVALSLDYLNSLAVAFVDGKKVAGEARFPAGEVDLTAVCRPGEKHVLSLLVVAMPLKAVRLSYTDSAAAREVKGSVARRGLCGDVFLVSAPAGPCVDDVRIDTSFRRSEITFNASLRTLDHRSRYVLRARITEAGKQLAEFTSKPFAAADVSPAGTFSFTASWKPERLWDLDTPQNQFEAQASLVDARDGEKTLDVSLPRRFGFRELWIDGRDFYLNGTRLFLSALPLDNASMGAAWATYDGAKETFERLKSIGINCVYAHNYDCEPGSHLSFDDILRAADDAGVLLALTQPHFSAYDWKVPDAEQKNGYARDAAFYARVAGSHPSVVFYSTSHNATGYDGDMNPDDIDGVRDPRAAETWSRNNAGMALRAEAILHTLDPTRIVYHHAGGNIGSMYTVNFYPNMAPVQELSDWFGHWAKAGVKPLFLCEYGAPFTWDWTMYRGWYKGKREFGSAAVPWEFCLAEWDAQFLGDRAFQLQEEEKANLRWEAKQFEAGKLWHRWDYPTQVGSPRFEQRNEVLATYLTDNLRAQRTWNVSGTSPWEYEIYWTPRRGVNRGRKELTTDWQNLQRPGLSPDYIDRRLERMDVAFERADWVPTAAGKALLRNNQPVLGYIAGKAEAFTSKDHNFRVSEAVEKQLIAINASRRKVTVKWSWTLSLPTPATGSREVTIEPGQQESVRLRFELPRELAPGKYELRATAEFTDAKGRQDQTDSFTLDVLPAPAAPPPAMRIALFDPKGETAELLRKRGLTFTTVDAAADLSGYELVVIGKHALSVDGAAPSLARVRDGLKVIVFEQTSAALERRLGFRVTEYGLRQVFPRVPNHPLLEGLSVDQFHDWRGEATTTPPRIDYKSVPMHGPTTLWCGIPVSRVWRCGNRGNVASVLIEKPARGDFRPILDGGFSLQYAPLMEYREGKGVVLFCQLDVTGRTEADPAAEAIVENLFRYVATWKPEPKRHAIYAGDVSGKAYVKSIGIEAASAEGQPLSADEVLVVGPGGGSALADKKSDVERFLKGGGSLFALGIDQHDADAFLPFQVSLKPAEHIASCFSAPPLGSPLAGVGPADVHNRGPRPIPLVSSGGKALGDGVLATDDTGHVIFCQMPPWQIDYRKSYNLKRTFRRAAFTTTRVLANLGVSGETPLLDRFASPARADGADQRWLSGLYLDEPEEWDDPYRFFRW